MGTTEIVAIVLAAVAGVALTAAGGTLAFFKLTGKPVPSLPCCGSGAEKAVAATNP
eukprot:SAG31_NODE_13728_length_851_cov_0.808511_2_plen_56_part_00